MVGPGFGPVDPEVAATVEAAAQALKGLGLIVEPVHIPALERDFALDVFNRLHVMEMKEALEKQQPVVVKMSYTKWLKPCFRFRIPQ